MNRKDFFKRLIGITGLAIIAPSVLSEPKCPLCLDTGEVVTFREGHVGEVTLKYDPERKPCPNCQPKLDGYNVPRKSLNGLQVYDPKDWSGLTSENHLGSLIDQMKPYHQQYNMTMIKLLSKFGA